MTNSYNNRLRTALSVAQPTGKWTDSFGSDLLGEIILKTTEERTSDLHRSHFNHGGPEFYLTGRAKRLTNVTSQAGSFPKS